MSQAISQGKQTQKSARIAGAVVMVCIVGSYVLFSVFSAPPAEHPWLLGSDTESHSDGTERPAKAPSDRMTAAPGAPGRRF